MLWRSEQLGRRRLLDDLAAVHDYDPVANFDHRRQIVRDLRHGTAELIARTAQQRRDLELDRGVGAQLLARRR
jgi:hypothetical protein